MENSVTKFTNFFQVCHLSFALFHHGSHPRICNWQQRLTSHIWLFETRGSFKYLKFSSYLKKTQRAFMTKINCYKLYLCLWNITTFAWNNKDVRERAYNRHSDWYGGENILVAAKDNNAVTAPKLVTTSYSLPYPILTFSSLLSFNGSNNSQLK